MITKFENAMKKLATLGQDPKQLIDCSAVFPIPVAKFKPPTLPAGKTLGDIEVSVSPALFRSRKIILTFRSVSKLLSRVSPPILVSLVSRKTPVFRSE